MREWIIGLIAVLLGPGAAAAEGAEEKKGPRVAIYSGSKEYASNESLAILKKALEERLGATCTLNLVEEKGDKLAGIEDLESADVAVFFTRRVSVSADQLEKVKWFVASGKGVVGVRTASHGFQTWLEFDKEILGGSYSNHYGKEMPAELIVGEKAKDHPTLAGVNLTSTKGKLYKNPKLAADVTLLLTAKTKDYSEPVAWTREPVKGQRGRIFYTSLGVPEDFGNADFVKMLVNAVGWTSGK